MNEFTRHDRALSLWGFFLLAALVHLWLATRPAGFFVARPSVAKRDDAPIEIEKWDGQGKQVVQTSKAEKPFEDEKIKPRFGGEFRNRVEKETRAPRTGRFQEGAPPVPKGEGAGQLKMADLLPFGSQGSKLPDDVAPGAQTLLNTDPVVYGSFLNRVVDEVRGPWERFLQEAVGKSERRIAAGTYVTTLRFVIDREGNVISITTLKSSGVEAIDSAPKRALWETEPFPNPPVELAKNEPTLPFVLEFHFELQKSLFGIVPWGI